MKYYCIMVKTGGEEEFKADAYKNASQYAQNLRFWFFRRPLRMGGKKNGKVIDDCPLFPGYVFMGVDDMTPEGFLYFFEKIKHSRNFMHFLASNQNIIPLYGKDLEYLQLLVNNGELSAFSRATFDENDRIVIISGLLQGLQGNIIRVNRRKQRVTVRLDMCGSINTVDFGYDLVSKDISGA